MESSDIGKELVESSEPWFVISGAGSCRPDLPHEPDAATRGENWIESSRERGTESETEGSETEGGRMNEGRRTRGAPTPSFRLERDEGPWWVNGEGVELSRRLD